MDRTTSVVDRTAALVELAHGLAGVRRTDRLFASIARHARQVLDAPTFCITLVDADGRARVAHATGVAVDRSVSYDLGESAACREQRAVVCEPGTAPGALAVGRAGSRALLAPIRRGSAIIGEVIALGGEALGRVQEDIDWLDAVSGIVAAALDLVRSAQSAELRRQEAERLEEISRAINESLELEAVLQRVVAAALDLADADYASVWLAREPGSVTVASALGALAPRVGLRAMIIDHAVEHWIDEPRVTVIRPSAAAPEYQSLRPLLPGAANIVVPLVASDRLLGCLATGHRVDVPYGSDQLRVIQRLALGAAIAIRNADLHEEVRNLSLTDPLTALANRRHMDIFLAKEFAAARRGRPLALLILDVDNFKQFNDTQGHAAGDAVLLAVADVLRDQTRAMNLAARFGGDEFVLVLSDGDRRGAFIHARRVAQAVRNDPLLAKIGLEVSIGIATYNARMKSPLDLIRAADKDLYRRKHDPNRSLTI